MTDSYADLAERYLDVTSQSGDEIMARCIVHDDHSASLQFNVRSGLWVCFSCGAKGNSKTLLRLVGGTMREPEVGVKDLYAALDALEMAQDTPRTAPVLPEATLKRYRFPTPYWASRGFSEATVGAFDLGYDPFEDAAIIPVRNAAGGLIGVIRRYLPQVPAPAKRGPKYLYPRGFPRKTSLFASWLVAKSATEHVVLTEGSLDAVAVFQAGVPALAIYGSSLTPEQVVLLRRLGITSVTLMFDGDEAGQNATYSALPLLRDFLISVVRYRDEDGPKPDPGGMDPATIKARVDQARRII